MFNTAVHPFEKSGLGAAPFRCVGVRENLIHYPDGSTQPGGCCDYCGTGLRWEYLIASANAAAQPFKVGCDCVEKTGANVADFKETRLKLAKERRAATAESRRASRAAKWEAEQLARKAERLTATEAWRSANAQLVSALTAYDGNNAFIVAMAHQLAQWGSLTVNQSEALRSAFAVIARNKAAAVTSTHIGEIGKRLKNAKVRVLRSIKVGEARFGYTIQPRVLVAMEDESGNQLTWWTSVYVDATPEFVTASFGVKDHTLYNEIKQTVVTRVTFN